MAGFVLVPLAAVLVLSMFLVIERGRVPQSLPVDRTGTFWLLPLEDAEDPAEMDPHPEVPAWAWVDSAWAARMDAAPAKDDCEARFEILEAAYAEFYEAISLAQRELVGAENFPQHMAEAQARLNAARAGWKWSSERWGAAMALPR